MSAGDKVTLVQYRTLRPVQAEEGATYGGTLGVNLFKSPGVLLKLSDFTSTAPSESSIDTTDDVEEGQWNLWFTNRRAQDAVGAILTDTDTIDLAYVGGTSITATLKDLSDSGAGAALVKLTRDTKGRISGTSSATTTDLTEGTNLYYTDVRADARISLQKGHPLGLATLDAGGKLDAGQLPALAITETFVVNTQAAMLALTAQEGDVAVRTDLSKSYILTTAPASALSNWQELLTPTSPVASVFGRVGSVTAATGDYTFTQIAGTPTTLAGYGITDAATAAQGATADSAVQSVVAGTNVTVDNTDPQNPVISATGGGGSGDVVGPASATAGAIALFDGTTGKLLKDGGALDKDAVGLSNADNTSDVNKPVSTAQAEAIALKLDTAIPAGYIDGLKMVWNSANSISATSGTCYIQGSSAVISFPSLMTLSGLSLTASTWYHLYGYLNAGTPAIELVTTAPAAAYSGTARSKTGDASRRYIGSIRTDASGNILKFIHSSFGGYVLYQVDINNAQLLILNGGTSTVDATVSAASAVPVISRLLRSFSENLGTTGNAFISNADIGTPASSNIAAFLRPAKQTYLPIELTSSQTFTYAVNGTSTLSMWVTGYDFER